MMQKCINTLAIDWQTLALNGPLHHWIIIIIIIIIITIIIINMVTIIITIVIIINLKISWMIKIYLDGIHMHC